MRFRTRAAVLAVLAALALAAGGSALAQLDLPGMDSADESTGGLIGPAVGAMGQTEHGECVKDLLNLPALDACEDAEGRVVMDLPGLTLVSPPDFFEQPSKPDDALPKTGVNVGDVAAIGMAALGIGGVFLRRLRLSSGA